MVTGKNYAKYHRNNFFYFFIKCLSFCALSNQNIQLIVRCIFSFFTNLSFRNVGSRWALDQAKYNLVNEYFLVGVTEELEDFIMLLEAALPRFFRGATELYRSGN